MRIINKDLTKESIHVYVSTNQIFVKIFTKNHGKWRIEEYFRSFDWEVDPELVRSTVRYITHTWNLTNPQVVIE